MLDQLGNTADDVASVLRAKGIRGVRHTVRSLNPICRYVQMQLGDPSVHVDVMSGISVRIIHPNGRTEEICLPPAVRQFLDAFNQGKCSDLELEHSHP